MRPSLRIPRAPALEPSPLLHAIAAALLAAGCAGEVDSQGVLAPEAEPDGAPTGAPRFHAAACGEGCDPMCVQEGRFLVSHDVVIDRETSLRWQRHVPSQHVGFYRAAALCRDLDAGGRSDWRLPTVAELDAILLEPGGLEAGHPGYCAPAIDQAAFPYTPEDFFWSNGLDRARGVADYVSFFDGRSHDDVVHAPLRVRCVAP